jgi:hypothetical protein
LTGCRECGRHSPGGDCELGVQAGLGWNQGPAVGWARLGGRVLRTCSAPVSYFLCCWCSRCGAGRLEQALELLHGCEALAGPPLAPPGLSYSHLLPVLPLGAGRLEQALELLD